MAKLDLVVQMSIFIGNLKLTFDISALEPD